MKNIITIIIITYQRGDELKSLLNSIQYQDNYHEYIYEIIIINNGDENGYEWINTIEIYQNQLKIKYIKSPINLGVSRGRKLGIEKSETEIMLFIDDDAEFLNKDALENISNYIEKEEKDIGALAFKILYFENREIQKNAFPHKKFRKFNKRKEFDTSHFIGAAHVLKKSVVEKVGNYTQDIFYGMEEYEMSYKIIEAKYKIRYTDKVTVLHKESDKGRQNSRIKNRMLWKNKSIIAWKFLPTKYFISTSVIWSFYYLIKNKLDFIGFLQTWSEIINSTEKVVKNKLSHRSMAYLKKVEARLWY